MNGTDVTRLVSVGVYESCKDQLVRLDIARRLAVVSDPVERVGVSVRTVCSSVRCGIVQCGVCVTAYSICGMVGVSAGLVAGWRAYLAPVRVVDAGLRSQRALECLIQSACLARLDQG